MSDATSHKICCSGHRDGRNPALGGSVTRATTGFGGTFRCFVCKAHIYKHKTCREWSNTFTMFRTDSRSNVGKKSGAAGSWSLPFHELMLHAGGSSVVQVTNVHFAGNRTLLQLVAHGARPREPASIHMRAALPSSAGCVSAFPAVKACFRHSLHYTGWTRRRHCHRRYRLADNGLHLSTIYG